MTTDRIVRWCSAVAATALMVGATAAQANATFVIYNADGPGEGFNDPTPATPVGGNPGTTLGQQRINAFQHAASVWGATLDSTVPITIVAAFNPLSCNATSAVLGSAGPRWIFSDFPGAPVPGTWYHASLTSKLAGEDPVPDDAMISAQFNSNLGQVGCLTGSPFYLGLDGDHGNAIDLVTVLLHEFGHGLGFSTVTNGGTGAQLGGQPSIYDHFAYDNVLGKTWVAMTDAERAFSATNPRQLAWNGPNVTARRPHGAGARDAGRAGGSAQGGEGTLSRRARRRSAPRSTRRESIGRSYRSSRPARWGRLASPSTTTTAAPRRSAS